MKKICISLLFTLIALFCFSGNINKIYYFDNPVILTDGGYQMITFENTLLTGITGEPALPYHEITLLLPPGEEAINVTYRFEEEVTLDGQFLLYPRQASRPLSMEKSGIFSLTESVYSSSESYPGNPQGSYKTHYMNGYSVLLSSFTPLRYIPSTGQVSYFRKVTVEVMTGESEKALAALKNLGTVGHLPAIRGLVSNNDLLAAYPVKNTRDEGYQILVITPSQFVSDFDEYKMLYLIRGMKTEVVSTETISLSVQGADLQEKIRNYIIQEYQNNGIGYVLLGGDDEHIPHRGFYCYVISGGGYEEYDIPADLYYSALDGNWNTNGDNKWGENGEDDLLPDVAVARWPFSNQSQLQRLLHKTSLYQDAPVTGELQRPLLAGEHLYTGPLTYGCDYLELLVGHHEDNGYTTDGIPESDDILYLCDEDAGWDKWDLIDAVNEGRNFIHHSGHANQTYVMRLDISDVNDDNFSEVNGSDHNYTLVYTHGCLCGAFDYNDCIGEAMVCIQNFAAAGAFNSRYGWFNEGQTEGPSAHLHREFVDALYDQKLNRIGQTHQISKVNTAPWVNAPGQWEEGALRWCFYACNVFGDPAMAIWTSEPIQIDVQYPDEILLGSTSYPVTVTNNGQPAEGMICVIMSGDQMTGYCVTDASGQAIIQIPGGFNGEMAELVVSGYHCLPHHYPLNVEVGIDPVDRNDAVSVFPIPFDDNITLNIYSDNLADATISFSLADGRSISSSRIGLNPGMNSETFDTSDWPSGMVILQYKSRYHTIIRKIIHVKK